jgi:arsenite methyltransferase
MSALDNPASPPTAEEPGAGETGGPAEDDVLRDALHTVSRRFDINSLLSEGIDRNSIAHYYHASDLAYRYFHSRQGAIHMALNYDGRFDPDGFLGQARLVEECIPKGGRARILELAAGRGFNSLYLAHRHPDAEIYGFDLAESHIRFANRKAQNLPNVNYSVADFENLPFVDGVFDVVFVVESICHAQDMQRALQESYRVLRPGGKLIVFDAFRADDVETLPNDLQLAARLTEVSMAVGQEWTKDDWVQLANSVGFTVTAQSDLTEVIRPNLLRLQNLAKHFFRRDARAKFISWLLPKSLVQNAIAGLLMPLTTSMGAHVYVMNILQRPETAQVGDAIANERCSIYSYKDYATSTQDYPTWIDRILRRFGLTPAILALSTALLVFGLGLAVSIVIGFTATYVSTPAIYMGLAGMIWVIVSLCWGSKQIHHMYEQLRPVFIVSDQEYLRTISLWFRRTMSIRGAIRASVTVFAIATVAAYTAFYNTDLTNHLTLARYRPIWFPADWYRQPYLPAKFTIILWYGAFVAILVGSTGRMLIIQARSLYALRSKPIVPLATIVRSRLRRVTNFYVLMSLAWAVGAALLALVTLHRVGVVGLTITAACSAVGLFIFLMPQLVFRTYLIAGYGGLCTWALQCFYQQVGIGLSERPVVRMPMELEIFYQFAKRAADPSANQVEWIADLVSATASEVTWVYDAQDFLALVFGQGLVLLGISLQVLTLIHAGGR